MNYWLMKSEPAVYSIDDLKRDNTTLWEGVRNYQARNFMINDMKVGDLVLFYHSNAEPSGIAGLAMVSKPASPDPSVFDKKSEYFDKKATQENPIWKCVEVKFKEKFKKLISLDKIKSEKQLDGIMLTQRGSRLSIQPVSERHFLYILKMAKGD